MKKILLVCFVVFACLPPSASAYRGFGLGVILGEPTGLSAKYWLDHKVAIDGAAAWSFTGEGSGMHLHSTFLFHNVDLIRIDREPLTLFYGPGVRLKLADDDALLGIRGAVGLEYFFRTVPIDLFVELAPVMDLVPSTALRFNLGLGGRYYF